MDKQNTKISFQAEKVTNVGYVMKVKEETGGNSDDNYDTGTSSVIERSNVREVESNGKDDNDKKNGRSQIDSAAANRKFAGKKGSEGGLASTGTPTLPQESSRMSKQNWENRRIHASDRETNSPKDVRLTKQKWENRRVYGSETERNSSRTDGNEAPIVDTEDNANQPNLSAGGQNQPSATMNLSHLQSSEVLYTADAELVDEEAEERYRAERYEELLQVRTEEIRQEIIQELPVAERAGSRTDQEKQQQLARARELRRKQMMHRRIGGAMVVGVALAVILSVVLTAVNEDDENRPSRMELLTELLAPVASGDALQNESLPHHKAFSWLLNEDNYTATLSSLDDEVQVALILERFVMALLYYATGGPNWIDPLLFLTNASVCDWCYGPCLIECVRGRLDTIFLVGNNMNGTIPSELSALQDLRQLSLEKNNIRGTIPTSIGDLRRLEALYLHNNMISGSLPASMGKLKRLETFTCYMNQLTGTIPAALVQHKSLEWLDMARNYLTGTIPDFLPQSEIVAVSLSQNHLSGTIPSTALSLPSLKSFSVRHNLLSGTIPTEVGIMVDLWELVLPFNMLTGPIPTELGNLDRAYYLNLSGNRLNGTIPTELGQMYGMENLWLSANDLTGSIPTELGQMADLYLLDLARNHFGGPIPSFLWTLPKLEIISLAGNNLVGNVSCPTQAAAPGFYFHTDCGGDNPEVKCPCCTACCDDATGKCKARSGEPCFQKKAELEEQGLDRGTSCTCEDDGRTLRCVDTECQICSGSVCYVDDLSSGGYGYRFDEFGAIEYSFLNIQYTSGLSESISYEVDGSETCSIAINGTNCKSCSKHVCTDAYVTSLVDCTNIVFESEYFMDGCKADPTIQNGGPLIYLSRDLDRLALLGSDVFQRYECQK